ncbi:MAG: MBL fold metallo-hydrolase [Pseudomonadales bacterium]
MQAAKWFLVILVVTAVALLLVYRADVAMWAMARAVASNMSTDTVAELPDGLHLAVCGAGAPLPDAARSGPCLGVIAGSRLFVVDAGSNGARNLLRMGLPLGRAEAVFLTHFHSDHFDGLGEMTVLRWTGGANHQPLPVYGPPGVEQLMAGLNQAYQLDAGYRTAHHGPEVAPPAGAGGRAVTFPIPEVGRSEVIWHDAGVTISAFTVDHAPVGPAVGYRFDYAGRSLVISGDTVKSAEVARVAQGVDLLAHEALSPRLVGIINRAATAAGQTNIAAITFDILDYHTTPVEAAETAAQAGVGHLLLYHVVPPLPLPGLAGAFLEGVSDAYRGPVTLSRDGTFVSMPAGSNAIDVSNRL